jgi:DNA polymerase elongation subunit (family B)
MLRKWNRIISLNDRIGSFHTKISGKGEGYLTIVYPQLMGKFHLDLQPVIVKNFRLKSYTLKSVSTKFLATTKIDLPFDCNHLKPCNVEGCKTQKSLYRLKTPEAFAEIGLYCVVDSELCIGLVKRLNVVGNQIEFANVVYFPLDRLFTSGEMKKIGSQIFVNGFQLGFLFEDKPYVENQEGLDVSGKKYQGARVLEPKVGAYMDNILACLDFASLYPSIMIRWNICTSTCTTLKPPKKYRQHYKRIQLDDGGDRVWVHQKVTGVLPVILRNLWCERKRIKQEMKLVVKTTEEGRGVHELLDAKQKAVKISMNSIYGIFGASVGDLAFMELSRAVCSVGREMIDQLCESIGANHKDMSVVYGDSVSASTPLVLRTGETHRCVDIETFWKELNVPPEGMSLEDYISREENNPLSVNFAFSDKYHGDKESYHFLPPLRFEIYSDQGWTSIIRIIRHRPKSKRLYRIRTANGSQVEVTGDHSLLLSDGTCVTPNKLKVGDVLLTNKFVGKTAGEDIPDFSKEVGENELHLFDLYHAQLVIQYLGPAFVEAIASGQTIRIVYNSSPDPFFESINPGTVTNIIRFSVDEAAWVYDLETANHHFSAGLGTLVVHNTDSVFVKLPTKNEEEAFALSEALAEELTTQLFEPPILLEFEKIYFPFILLKKKNYVGMKTEYFGGPCEMEDKGLISVQRSTPVCVAQIYQQVIDALFQTQNPFVLYEMTKAYLEKLLNDEIPFLDFVQSARLKDDYVNPLAIPHARVAMAVNNRAGTDVYNNGDRVQYVRYCPPDLCTSEVDALNVAEKVEDPNYVLSRKYKIDYRSYILQMEKAFMELAKFFPEVFKLEQVLFSQSLNDDRVHDGLVKIKGTGGKVVRVVNGVEEKSKPLKKRKISYYFLPIAKKD